MIFPVLLAGCKIRYIHGRREEGARRYTCTSLDFQNNKIKNNEWYYIV